MALTEAVKPTAIVTGGASGFGAGAARRLARDSVNVAIFDLNEELGQTVVSEIISAGGKAIFVKVNVTSADAWKAGVEQVVQTFGGLNFVINNAGGTYASKPVLETTEADFDKCINLNLRSIYHSVIACMPSLIAATDKGLPASMVNIASTGGVKGRPGLTWYSASKAGAINATQSLAHEFADHQIRVNCICPVLGKTPMMSQFLGQASEEQYLSTIPLKRFAEPSDIGNSVAFLCSDDARFLTGVVLPVDGGRLA
ncbi:hypothetical protein JCM24511_02164 [Saitozyma sp. JCM 24511]|nr:hypothetical protein JCM24511_02164 [Saitozyma sp. JCM 24511]